jgi:ubiquinone/menaquinone biosynthesis C-methylase UbiE
MTLPLLQREQYGKGGIGRWYWDYRDRRALAFIRDERNILDVGCGEGITLEKLLQGFPDRNVIGIDYSSEKVKICGQHQLPARNGNACKLEFSDHSFDCCLFLEVVEHLLDPLMALKEIHRVLRKGGLFLLIFPNDWLFKVARLSFLKFKEAFSPSGHVKQWTPSEMRKTLEKVGFEIQETACLPFHFWWCSLHCLMISRKK